MRPTIEQTLMQVAHLVALRGTCSRRQVGAVIADTRGVILSTGYNGALSGMQHCDHHDDYQPCDISEHAERNAIYWAARRGIAIEDTILFTTDSPCPGCARGIVQCGIVKVVYDRPYRENIGTLLLQAAGIEVVKYESQ